MSMAASEAEEPAAARASISRSPIRVALGPSVSLVSIRPIIQGSDRFAG